MKQFMHIMTLGIFQEISLKEIAKKMSIILNYHFIYNVLTMRMPEGWYYQYSGTIREIDSIYNEYKDIYEKIEQKFIQ